MLFNFGKNVILTPLVLKMIKLCIGLALPWHVFDLFVQSWSNKCQMNYVLEFYFWLLWFFQDKTQYFERLCNHPLSYSLLHFYSSGFSFQSSIKIEWIRSGPLLFYEAVMWKFSFLVSIGFQLFSRVPYCFMRHLCENLLS